MIGSSWAPLLLGRGLRVVATDPAPDAEPALRAALPAMLGGPVEADRS